jgi:hypothetical protein
MGEDWFTASRTGRLGLKAIELYFVSRPVISEIQNRSILGVVDGHRNAVGRADWTNSVHCERASASQGVLFASQLREPILQETSWRIPEATE